MAEDDWGLELLQELDEPAIEDDSAASQPASGSHEDFVAATGERLEHPRNAAAQGRATSSEAEPSASRKQQGIIDGPQPPAAKRQALGSGTGGTKPVAPAPAPLLAQLSEPLLLRVLCFLSPEDLCSMGRVSRLFHGASNDKALWRRLYLSRWAWEWLVWCEWQCVLKSVGGPAQGRAGGIHEWSLA